MKRLIYLSILIILLGACNNMAPNSSGPGKFTCTVDCEDYKDGDKKHNHDIGDLMDVTVTLGGELSEKEAHSGKKSIYASKKSPYALAVTFENVQENEFYRVSIWRKDKTKKASLIVQGNISTILYETDKVGEKGTLENGWEKLEIEFEVPPHINEIKVYGWIARGENAFFDDLTVEKLPKKKYYNYKRNDAINLYFGDRKMAKFKKSRENAFAEGVHFSDGTWNKGIFSSTDGPIPIKARFKGDWLDHLKGEKWSFRIKTRKGNTYKRMKQFSVQTPESRYYLHEYIAHQLLFQEGLLTTRYEFAPLYLNQESRGIYAIEEHFTKQLIEYNLRREGPILKFDENPMWRNMALQKGINKIDNWQLYPNFKTSRILAFGSSQITEDAAFKSKFEIAHSLLYQFKERLAPVDELFEIEKLGKYLALLDLHGGKHGAVWHNVRFYYNPISCKLEIINYDNFTDHFGDTENPKSPPTALEFEQVSERVKFQHFYTHFFTSKDLRESYLHYLRKFSTQEYIKQFYAKIEPKVDEYLALIQVEFPYYSVDQSFLLENAKSIRNQIPLIQKRHNSGFYDSLKMIDLDQNLSEQYIPHIFQYFVNGYYDAFENEAQLLIENFSNVSVKPLRILDENNRPLYKFKEGNEIEAYHNRYSADTFYLPYFQEARFIEFSEPDSNFIFNVEITPWRKNTSPSPYQKLRNSERANPLQLFTERNDSLILTKGSYQLNQKVLIKENKTVVIEAGAQLDMINEAAIISHSPLFCLGTAESPIIINSSDKSSNGLVVLQATSKSLVRHTQFKNLNTFTYEGWTLSGAVNFYESDVDISHSTFEANLCEDALNIIRSDFYVSNCQFKDIFADAFDSDFCTGTLTNTNFNYVGNDAIDFSTSQIKIDSCIIQNISDKGISGGEGSTLWVSNTTIDQCNIGTASKDLSEVYLTNVSISNSVYGLVALKKKPEYGPAKLITKKFSMENCDTELLIEKGSVVKLNGRKVEGTRKNVAEMFY